MRRMKLGSFELCTHILAVVNRKRWRQIDTMIRKFDVAFSYLKCLHWKEIIIVLSSVWNSSRFIAYFINWNHFLLIIFISMEFVEFNVQMFSNVLFYQFHKKTLSLVRWRSFVAIERANSKKKIIHNYPFKCLFSYRISESESCSLSMFVFFFFFGKNDNNQRNKQIHFNVNTDWLECMQFNFRSSNFKKSSTKGKNEYSFQVLYFRWSFSSITNSDFLSIGFFVPFRSVPNRLYFDRFQSCHFFASHKSGCHEKLAHQIPDPKIRRENKWREFERILFLLFGSGIGEERESLILFKLFNLHEMSSDTRAYPRTQNNNYDFNIEFRSCIGMRYEN